MPGVVGWWHYYCHHRHCCPFANPCISFSPALSEFAGGVAVVGAAVGVVVDVVVVGYYYLWWSRYFYSLPQLHRML